MNWYVLTSHQFIRHVSYRYYVHQALHIKLYCLSVCTFN